MIDRDTGQPADERQQPEVYQRGQKPTVPPGPDDVVMVGDGTVTIKRGAGAASHPMGSKFKKPEPKTSDGNTR